jgi:septum formation protein
MESKWSEGKSNHHPTSSTYKSGHHYDDKHNDDKYNDDKHDDDKHDIQQKESSFLSSSSSSSTTTTTPPSSSKYSEKLIKDNNLKLYGRGGAVAFQRKTNLSKSIGGGRGGGGIGSDGTPSSPTDSMLSPCTKKLRRKQSKKLSNDSTGAAAESNNSLSLNFWVPPENVDIILGSSSSSRGQILVDLGWDFKVVTPNIPEENYSCEDPLMLPILLAKEKAKAILKKLFDYDETDASAATASSSSLSSSLSSSYTNTSPYTSLPYTSSSASSTVILTCDQIVLYHGHEIRNKPRNRQEAKEFLLSYQKNEIIQTVSAVVATHFPSGKQAVEIDLCTIHWKGIPEDVIENKLLDKEEIYSSCGAILIEDPDFLAYVDHIDGDLDSIRGMPIKATKKVFRDVLSADI